MDKIKIVKYEGRLNPIYKEIGEIELLKIQIGNSDKEELCIDIEDIKNLMESRF